MDKDLAVVREVLVYNQPKQKHYIFQTSTDKWTELADLIVKQPELEVKDINAMRAVVHSTQNTLELPNAIIPTGPQKIFLFEAKVKSGMDYAKLNFGELRRLAKSKGVSEGLGGNPTRKALEEALEKAAGIKRTKVAKVTKTGKTVNKKVVTHTKETASIMEADKDIIDNQPTLSERVSALETGFEKLVTSLYKACSDFVKPKIEEVVKIETKIGDFDLDSLAKEANKLKI